MYARAPVLAALVTCLAVGCSSEPPSSGGPVPATIVVTPAVLNIVLGSTEQLDVTVLDGDGDELTGVPITFTTGDQAVATVSSAGVVTAVGSGSTSITVRSNPASASILTVVVSPASLELSHSFGVTSTLSPLQLTAVVRSSANVELPAAPVTWTTRNATIASVTGSGFVTAGSVVGTTWIVASSGPARDSTLVTALVGFIPASGMPYGVAVAPSGLAYATLALSGQAARLTVGTFSAVAGPGVGALPTAVTFNSTGSQAFVGNQDGRSVSVINTSSHTVVGTVPINGAAIGVTVAPGDTTLLVGTDMGRLYFVHIPSMQVVDSVNVPPNTNSIVVRGNLAWANSTGSGSVTEINLDTRQVVRTLPVGGVPQGLVVAADGSELYVANEIGQLQFWNLATGMSAGSVSLPGGGGFGLALSPATGFLYVSTSYFSAAVHVVNPANRSPVRTIVLGGVPRRIAFNAAGDAGLVTNENGWIDVIR